MRRYEAEIMCVLEKRRKEKKDISENEKNVKETTR